MRLYSRSFRADCASMILDDLGLVRQHLCQHISKRQKFFGNKERYHKLKTLVSSEDSELDIDRKMLAVVARAGQPELFNILQTLSHSMAAGDGPSLEAIPSAWTQIERFGLEKSFWAMVESAFGYDEERPALKNLLIRLMVSDYAYHLATELPSALRHLQLPSSGTPNAVVFLAQWRDSSSKASSCNELSTEVGTLLVYSGSSARLWSRRPTRCNDVSRCGETHCAGVARSCNRQQPIRSTLILSVLSSLAGRQDTGYLRARCLRPSGTPDAPSMRR